MRLVRFLERAYVDGRLWEKGDEGLIDERHAMDTHIVDLETGETREPRRPHDIAVLDHRSDRELRRVPRWVEEPGTK